MPRHHDGCALVLFLLVFFLLHTLQMRQGLLCCTLIGKARRADEWRPQRSRSRAESGPSVCAHSLRPGGTERIPAPETGVGRVVPSVCCWFPHGLQVMKKYSRSVRPLLRRPLQWLLMMMMCCEKAAGVRRFLANHGPREAPLPGSVGEGPAVFLLMHCRYVVVWVLWRGASLSWGFLLNANWHNKSVLHSQQKQECDFFLFGRAAYLT